MASQVLELMREAVIVFRLGALRAGSQLSKICGALSTEEVAKAKERAPLDRDGVLLCWGALTHMGCSNASCQRSHAGLQGKLETLDPHVQMQLLRRGGLKRMKAETRESAAEKIKGLRAAVAADKATKVADGRKSGESAENEETRAGGNKTLKFHEVPEEFEAIDFTAAETEMQEYLKGPDDRWLHGDGGGDRVLASATGESAPLEAKELVRRAEEMATGPVLGPLREASDDLFAWAAARVARQPDATLEDVLGDMAMYGLGDLAEEASRILEKNVGHKAGASAGIEVSETTWTAGGPGSGTAVIEGVTWKTWDYREDIHVSEELAAMLRQPEEGREKRQCVTNGRCGVAIFCTATNSGGGRFEGPGASEGYGTSGAGGRGDHGRGQSPSGPH